MNSKSFILLLLLGGLFSSCIKEYTCLCTLKDNPEGKSVVTDISTKRRFTRRCLSKKENFEVSTLNPADYDCVVLEGGYTEGM